MIYVASPYSHTNPEVRYARAETSFRYVFRLKELGRLSYSPLAYSALFVGVDPEPSYEFWIEHCLKILGVCSELHVLCLDGWELSKGVCIEIDFAQAHNIPVTYIEAPDEDF